MIAVSATTAALAQYYISQKYLVFTTQITYNDSNFRKE
ncbi:hypothetical protein KP77_27260 [Jeotgalibacillus alimentarius]|uniref:Uncharacterized protein n=1 Tax=Jeotgalibacillus alimentarius TaxID=135826 RepID=A0A0C2RXV2_9BACL|nr:hypothetical protein KP77_27260 [Jeotgalibacillus alimentarius]